MASRNINRVKRKLFSDSDETDRNVSKLRNFVQDFDSEFFSCVEDSSICRHWMHPLTSQEFPSLSQVLMDENFSYARSLIESLLAPGYSTRETLVVILLNAFIESLLLKATPHHIFHQTFLEYDKTLSNEQYEMVCEKTLVENKVDFINRITHSFLDKSMSLFVKKAEDLAKGQKRMDFDIECDILERIIKLYSKHESKKSTLKDWIFTSDRKLRYTFRLFWDKFIIEDSFINKMEQFLKYSCHDEILRCKGPPAKLKFLCARVLCYRVNEMKIVDTLPGLKHVFDTCWNFNVVTV